MSLAQVTIYGAGLMGGSLALAAREKNLAARIVAIDRSLRPELSHAQVFDDWLRDNDTGINQVLSESSLVVLCVPVGAIIHLLPHVLEKTGGWVTDFGSTKRAITESVANHRERRRFVAGHPMAGHPKGGLSYAQPNLFQDRKWILCPEGSDPEGIKAVSDLAEGVGARVLHLSAQTHDESVAMTSHVPQVVASALSVQADQQNALQAAGPGFASATRVAGGAEGMWRDIFETNGVAIGEELKRVGSQLHQLGENLLHGDVEATLLLLEAARTLRDKESP
jgi:prephenate dehydrogenase